MKGQQQGFALLIVLASVVLLALMLSALLANGRSAIIVAGNMRDAAAARAATDGAINEALFHALAGGAQHWAPDAGWHQLPGGVDVRIVSLGGLVNPNIASTDLLAGLLQASGTDAKQARRVAEAIIEWRSPPVSAAAAAARVQAYRQAGLAYAPSGAPFADVAELGDVLGMTPGLLARMLPVLSLQQRDDPDPTLAGPLVRRALRLAGLQGAIGSVFTGAFPVVQIEARKAGVQRAGVFSLAGAQSPHPYSVMLLTDG